MTYNCLFTVLTDAALVDETLTHAIAAAKAHDAHLDVLSLGVDRSQTGYYYAGASAIVLQETISRAQDDADEIDRLVRARLDGERSAGRRRRARASSPISAARSRPGRGFPIW